MTRQTLYGILRLSMLGLVVGRGVGLDAPRLTQAEEPSVRVENARRAFHNGEHNAFTDLCRFDDRLYLTFRSCPDGHGVFPTSSILVLASEDDGRSWEQVHCFNVPRRDTRDPHFLILNDRLFVISGTWFCGDSAPENRTVNRHLGYASWSDDGRSWQGPKMLEGTYGHYVWRATSFNGKGYLCAYRREAFEQFDSRGEALAHTQTALLESEDGLVWTFRSLCRAANSNETAFLFQPDGSLLAVSRSGGGNAVLCRSNAPYEDWTDTDLGRYVGGPMLERWEDRLLVGGRKQTDEGPKTVLSWLEDDRLVDVATLPSGGDNSYPGFVELGPKRGLVSWYSSHETDANGNRITAIYLAEIVIEEDEER